jgi:HK97 family phage portal protein
LIDYYEIRPWGSPSGALKFPVDEVIHLKQKHPLSKLDGYSKLAAIAQWIDTEESISTSRWSQFKNRARPEMWIKLNGDVFNPDDDEIRRVQAKISEKLKGEYRTGEPVVMNPGAEIVPLNWTPQEMGYIESEEQIKRMILSAFGVPPAVLGDAQGMTYGSVLAAQAAFCTFAINPRLAYLGQVMTEKLAARYDRRLRIWWDDCTPADPTQVNADLALDLQYGVRTLNEARAVRGLEPYQHGGDDPMVGMGLAPLPLNTGEEQDTLAGLGDMASPIGEEKTEPPEPPEFPRPKKNLALKSPRLNRMANPRLKSRLRLPSPSKNGVC